MDQKKSKEFDSKIREYIELDGRKERAICRAMGYDQTSFKKWREGWLIPKDEPALLNKFWNEIHLPPEMKTEEEKINLFQLAGLEIFARNSKASDDSSNGGAHTHQEIDGQENIVTSTGDVDVKITKNYYSNTPTPEGKQAWKVPFEENLNFTGRKELLKDLKDNLNKGETTAVTQAIHGLGGIGKTQLAVKYTYENQKEYEVIWWLHSEEESSLATDYGRLALTLKLTTSEDIREQIQAAEKWLNNNNDKWLLVFDNAKDPETIHNYVPTRHRGHIIITSRYHNWSTTAKELEVKVWSEEEAIRYLEKRVEFPE